MFYRGDPGDPRHTSMRAARAYGFPAWGWIDKAVADLGYVIAQYDVEIACNSEHLGPYLDALKALRLGGPAGRGRPDPAGEAASPAAAPGRGD
jgi:hypothetical protein